MCAFLPELSLKQFLEQQILTSLQALQEQLGTDLISNLSVKIEKTREKSHGDFASNVAMVAAAKVGKKPRELADKIVQLIPESDRIEKIEIAGPGFINFFLKQDFYHEIVPTILDQGPVFGRCDHGQQQSVIVEYVSANPTGPLHIGHGRGAAYGAVTANLLEATGFNVHREYYVNDAGRQMDILAISVYLRYLQVCNKTVNFPDKIYQGEYVIDIAKKLQQQKQESLCLPDSELTTLIRNVIESEEQIDQLIATLKQKLGTENYLIVFNTGLQEILADIQQDLSEFGVEYDQWYSERSLLESGEVARYIESLDKNGYLYKKDGATWFQSSRFGDEKDRVVIRENGQLTYFASDIAYHAQKYKRGFQNLIDVWGADHHGYIPRIKASLEAQGLDSSKLKVLLVQFATLYRGREKIQMSTRSGQFVTLRELRNEVGKDACRFFYVMRKSDQHLDFDLDLAKSQSQDNPVYYIQYAHARICSVFRQASEKGYEYVPQMSAGELTVLDSDYEMKILNRLTDYPEILLSAALENEPHQLGYYLRDLANDFHTYYNACQILVDDTSLRNARLTLIAAIRQVIKNTLELLGVSAPEMM